MNFQRLEGMGPAIGIVLIIMITTWLGLWGPIDIEALKGWQTLTTGCLAIIAACIAYWGSSATARFSERVHREEIGRRKLALYIKLEFACRQLFAQGRSAQVYFPPINADLWYLRKRFLIDEPAEIEEAWTYLDILPRHLISEIRSLRNGIRELAILAKDNPEEKIRWPLGENEMPYPLSEMNKRANVIWVSAAVIADTLEPLIVAMAPEMDQSEKLNLIYGDYEGPDDYDDEGSSGDTASRQQ